MLDFQFDKYNDYKESLVRITKKSCDIDSLLNEVDIDQYIPWISGTFEARTHPY